MILLDVQIWFDKSYESFTGNINMKPYLSWKRQKMAHWSLSSIAVLTGTLKVIDKSADTSWSEWVRKYRHLSSLLAARVLQYNAAIHGIYSKWSKVLNISNLTKRSPQTVQTQIRLLLKEQSDKGLHCLLFWRIFSESINCLKNQTFCSD